MKEPKEVTVLKAKLDHEGVKAKRRIKILNGGTAIEVLAWLVLGGLLIYSKDWLVLVVLAALLLKIFMCWITQGLVIKQDRIINSYEHLLDSVTTISKPKTQGKGKIKGAK